MNRSLSSTSSQTASPSSPTLKTAPGVYAAPASHVIEPHSSLAHLGSMEPASAHASCSHLIPNSVESRFSISSTIINGRVAQAAGVFDRISSVIRIASSTLGVMKPTEGLAQRKGFEFEQVAMMADMASLDTTNTVKDSPYSTTTSLSSSLSDYHDMRFASAPDLQHSLESTHSRSSYFDPAPSPSPPGQLLQNHSTHDQLSNRLPTNDDHHQTFSPDLQPYLVSTFSSRDLPNPHSFPATRSFSASGISSHAQAPSSRTSPPGREEQLALGVSDFSDQVEDGVQHPRKPKRSTKRVSVRSSGSEHEQRVSGRRQGVPALRALDEINSSADSEITSTGLGDFSPVFIFLSAEKKKRVMEDNLRHPLITGGSNPSMDRIVSTQTDVTSIASTSSPRRTLMPPRTKRQRSALQSHLQSTTSAAPLRSTSAHADSHLSTTIHFAHLDRGLDPSRTMLETRHPMDRSGHVARFKVEPEMSEFPVTKKAAVLPLARATYRRRTAEEKADSIAKSHSTSSALSLHQAPIGSASLSLAKCVYVRPTSSQANYPNPKFSTSTSYTPSPLMQSKPLVAFPLTSLTKSQSLPRKLELAFPDDESLLSNSARLYTPGILSTTGRSPIADGPTEDVRHGFWPAPPPLNTGKGLYPAPLILPDSVEPELDASRRVDIFIDNSNIVYSFLNWLGTRPEAHFIERSRSDEASPVNGSVLNPHSVHAMMIGGKKARIDYTTLFAILERGRKISKRVLVGSSPLWQGLDPAVEWGYEVSILQRVPRESSELVYPPRHSSNNSPAYHDSATDSNTEGEATSSKRSRRRNDCKPVLSKVTHFKEQAVDELLHLKMLESLLDYIPPASSIRPLLVLATGDANASEYNPTGFLGCVRRALERGWDVEIAAFPHGTSSTWLSEEVRANFAADEVGDGAGQRGRLTILDLQMFAEELVL